MPEANWIIRFYLPFDESNTISFVGSFENTGKRYLDDIVIFRGMYEIPDYLMWYIHKDLVNYNFSGYSIEIKLYLGGGEVYFQDKYRIVDVGDDFKSDRKVVYAIQEDYAKLENLLIDSNISKLEYNETRTPEQVLRDVLEVNGIFPVQFIEHDDPDLMSVKFEYPKFTLDPKWTVGDFIKYIADENKFEWTVKYGQLFIGPELKAYKELNATREYIDRKVDNISKNYFNMKIGFSGSPLDVLYYYQLKQSDRLTDMRCVWAKHWVGSNGDVTKGCFLPVGTKTEKTRYIDSLEGQKEQLNAYGNFFKVVKFNPAIELCRVITDEGNDQYADVVTIEKKIDEYAKKTPRNVVMNIENPIYTVDKVGRTTPYLDNNAGLFFPRTNDLTNNPNQLLFFAYDRIEQAILGPYVMGNGDSSFTIPTKNPDDFRFQLPSGWCMYVKDDGTTIIQTSAAVGSIPTGSGTFIKMTPNGDIEINTTGDIKLAGGANQLAHANHTHNFSHTHSGVLAGAATTGPATPSATDACSDNTSKVKAD